MLCHATLYAPGHTLQTILAHATAAEDLWLLNCLWRLIRIYDLPHIVRGGVVLFFCSVPKSLLHTFNVGLGHGCALHRLQFLYQGRAIVVNKVRALFRKGLIHFLDNSILNLLQLIYVTTKFKLHSISLRLRT